MVKCLCYSELISNVSETGAIQWPRVSSRGDMSGTYCTGQQLTIASCKQQREDVGHLLHRSTAFSIAQLFSSNFVPLLSKVFSVFLHRVRFYVYYQVFT